MASHEQSPSSPTSRTSILPAGIRSSPRSSLEGAPSPFLQNLQQRFRKVSNASLGAVYDGPGRGQSVADGNVAAGATGAAATRGALSESESTTTTTTKSRSEASRSAKRYLADVVKDDWEYPGQLEDADGERERELRRGDVMSWRRREDGMSDLESEKEGRRRSARARAPMAQYGSGLRMEKVKEKEKEKEKEKDPYKFDNPDAVGDFVEEKRRKRRKLVEEECVWNEGVRNWVAQRDAWTGAMESRVETGSRRKRRGQRLARLHERNESGGTDDSEPLSAASQETGNDAEGTSSLESSVDDGPAGEEGPWLPIYPPLFDEDNILRSRIQPTAYPTIYSKVVVQSLTPNIPIPLTHMTKVLVEGWKSEGAWPPGPAPQVAKDVKTGRKSSAFMRWRNGKDDGKEGKRERVRKSIGFVKKAVGLEREDRKDVGIEFEEHESVEEDREASRIY